MKFFKQTCTLCAMTIALIACDQTTPTSQDKINITLSNATGMNYGDYYESGTNTLALDFYSANLSYNTETGEYEGTGYNLYMTDVFISTASEKLEAGTYTVDTESGKVQTFYPGSMFQKTPYGALLTTVTSGSITVSLLTVGSFTVELKEDSTIISFNLQTSDGIDVTAQYRGIIVYPENNSDNAYSWEPKDTSTLEYAFTNVSATNYNDVYELGFDDIELMLEDNKAFVVLDMLFPLNTGLTIPAGTYPINDSYAVNTVIASAGYMEEFNVDLPSYLGIYTDAEAGEYGDTYYLISGNVTISKNGDEYNLTLNGVSYYGSIINATYKGNIAVQYDTDDSIEQQKIQRNAIKRVGKKSQTKIISTHKIVLK